MDERIHPDYADGDTEVQYRLQPVPSTSGATRHWAHKPDYNCIQAQVEEQFQDKLPGCNGRR